MKMIKNSTIKKLRFKLRWWSEVSETNFVFDAVSKASNYWIKAILTLQLPGCSSQKVTVLSKIHSHFFIVAIFLYTFYFISTFCVWCWSSQQMPLPPLPFLRLAVIPSGFPLRGNHSLSQTPSGSRALGKMMGSHLLSEKKKNIFTVSEVWRCWVKMKKKNLKKKTKRKKEKAWLWSTNSFLILN